MAALPVLDHHKPKSMHPRNANSVRKPAESALNLSLFSSTPLPPPPPPSVKSNSWETSGPDHQEGDKDNGSSTVTRRRRSCGSSGGGSSRRCYAVDAEMVTVRLTSGEEKRAMVSVGIVNDRLETVLYSRVAVPEGCEVVDGAFARVHGGLWASWQEGIPASCVSDLLARHAAAGGLIIGWELHGDLEVVGFKKAAALAKEGERDGLPLEVTPLVPTSSLDGHNDAAAAASRGSGGGDRTFHSENSPETRHRQHSKNGEAKETNGYLRAAVGHRNDGRGGNSGDDSGSSKGGSNSSGGVTPSSSSHRSSHDDVETERQASTAAASNLVNPRRNSGEGGSDGSISDWTNSTQLRIHSRQGGETRELTGEADDDEGDVDENGGGEGCTVDGASRTVMPSDGGDVTAGPTMTVVDVTDLFRTTKGRKCMLSEAYFCAFGRADQGAHDAAADARMTMELYNLWRRVGEPEGPIGIPLCFFVVNFHSFKNAKSRQEMMWRVLRPERGGRATVVEHDSGINTYKLFFRNERERDAYLNLLRGRMSAAGLKWGLNREEVPGRKGAKDGYQLSCRQFKMHVLEQDR